MIKARLISYSKSVIENEGIKDVKDLISYCARVSNPKNQNNTKTSDKLLKYLMKHKHWSPFEMASACMEITTTRDIARQILRHRSFSFQEYSQRYAEVDLKNPITREARLQDPENRQNSIETDNIGIMETWKNKQFNVIEFTNNVYNWALRNGIAKEQARVVLPEGLTPSTMLMNGTIRSWIHYIELRTHEGTQKEHREIAQECAKAIHSIFSFI
mgnify:CR=1 FL=1